MTAPPSIQSSAPTFSLATLREVLAEMEAAHPERASRLVRAANIVAVRAIEQSPDSGLGSSSRSATRRTPTLSCTSRSSASGRATARTSSSAAALASTR